MQIVRDLGGYTLGRSDLVRRAMSKKKQEVMEKERRNFVYGNEKEGVPGCVSKGISEQTANKIYDGMMSFAEYAFNKSHAAAYAVVAYQTAFLKYYYPVEFMAALMTSVIDNGNKVSEYIYTCRSMGITILPPDINRGVAGFSVSNGEILYGLASIKGIGWPVIEAIVEDRKALGPFKDLEDFIIRMNGREVNKRSIENFIKAGAFDCFGGTRKQFMAVYIPIMDRINQDKKNNMAGQMSLFDIAEEETQNSFKVELPNIGEFTKEGLLAYEKEVLGIYVSGHPLQEYEALWRKHITALTSDFLLDEETGLVKVEDGARVTIGGMIESKTVKYTKSNKTMAFLNIEDLVGTVEVIVWPNDYEKNSKYLTEDSKVFIEGRVSCEEDKNAKLICDRITPFDAMPRKVWVKFATRDEYALRENQLFEAIADSDGFDTVTIYIEATKEMKNLPKNRSVKANEELKDKLAALFGEENIRIV